MGSDADRHGALHSAARRRYEGGVQRLLHCSLPRRTQKYTVESTTLYKCCHPVRATSRPAPPVDSVGWEPTQPPRDRLNEWREWPTALCPFS